MKKLLLTTALVGLMAAPAAAETVIMERSASAVDLQPTQNTRVESQVNADGSITETTITETVTPRASTSLMVTSEVSAMDLLKNHDWDRDGDYDHKHTVITIEGMTPAELNARIGDQDGDGDIDRFDLATYVGDIDMDGDVDYVDYMARFGDQNIKVDYTYDYDPEYNGTTAYISPTTDTVIVDDGVNIRTTATERVILDDDADMRTSSELGYRLNRQI